jgi:perosamine synthetase
MPAYGAGPSASFIPRWPQIEEEDIKAATEVLRSARLSQLTSTAVSELEAALARYHEVEHCVVVSSGTAAIHVALAALDIGPGDDVIVPAHTFIGSAEPILYQGARPVFADVDEQTFCLSPETLSAAMTPQTRAVIVVHLNGYPVDVDSLRPIAAKNGAQIIEDSAQALGASYRGGKVGTSGVAGCISFYEEKIISTAGEGGAVITNDDGLAQRMRRLRHHGEDALPGTRWYCSHELGYNYRLSAVQAAVGLAQSARLDAYLQARRANARFLSEHLSDIPGLLLPQAPSGHSWWKYVCRMDLANSATSIDSVLESIQNFGVPAYRRYPVPLHRQPVFRPFVSSDSSCSVADLLSRQLFSLPVHPALRPGDLDLIVKAVTDAFQDVA